MSSSDESSTDENYAQINQWLDYFADAQIPPQAAAQYAVNFAEQRIPLDRAIIAQLAHDELKELGVELLGDRLSIKNAAKKEPKKQKKKKIEKVRVKKQDDDEISRVISKAKADAKLVERVKLTESSKRANPFIREKSDDDEGEGDEDDNEEVTVKRRSLDTQERKIVRPFTSGPVWRMNEPPKEVQEDQVSSSTNQTSFAITGLWQTAVTRDTGPKVKCSFESLNRPATASKPVKPAVHNRLGGGGGGVEKITVKNRLGARSVKSRLGL